MKKEMKNYTGLSLMIVGISLLVMFFFMTSAIILDINPNTYIFDFFRTFVLGSWGIAVLSVLYFFASVIYNQFRDKRILLGIINTIALIIYLNSYLNDEEVSDFALFTIFIVLISCLWYYFYHIRPKFRKKK